MITLFNTITDSAGGVADILVVAKLSVPSAFNSTTGEEVAAYLSTVTDSDGRWQFDLEPLTNIDVPDVFYAIIEYLPFSMGGTQYHTVSEFPPVGPVNLSQVRDT